jgi:hypothetical protein
MLPPTEVLLIVKPPICVTQLGAEVDVPLIVMLFAVTTLEATT